MDIKELRMRAAALPAEGAPEVRQARQYAMRAVETVAAALEIDPTLADEYRKGRDIDWLATVLDQLLPLAITAENELAYRRGARRFSSINPEAPEFLDRMSRGCIKTAENILEAALPDWNTPQRIRERSERLLPAPAELEEIADRLRHAVKQSLDLPYPDPEAVRLAALADQIDGRDGGR